MTGETLAARLRAAFAEDVEEQLRLMDGGLAAMERDPSAGAHHLAALFRAAHTLKGAARVAGLPCAENLCHAMEDVLAAARAGALALTHGHVALLRSAADALAATARRLRAGDNPDAAALDTVAAALAAADLHDLPHASANPGARDRSVADDVSPVAFTLSEPAREHQPHVRARTLADACEALPRIVADAAEACGRRARVEIRGGEVPIGGAMVAALREALMHLARNAVAHGIEPPEARERAGKLPVGTVAVEAGMDAGTLRVTVADDGGGLDLAALRAVMDDDGELAELLFEPGVTTRPVATAISGRGVGLDAVRAAMRRIGGTVSVDSEAGRGTTFTLQCPVYHPA